LADEPRVLRASEIGEYVFCHRAWWLHRIQGIESVNRAQMQAGTARHLAHGRAVQRADALRRVARAMVLVALFFAAAFLLAALASLR
jgi:hypothetical protein